MNLHAHPYRHPWRNSVPAIGAAVCLLGVLATAVPARAQSGRLATAEALHDSAQASLARGDVREAYTLFFRAHRYHSRSVPILVGLGRSLLERQTGTWRAIAYLTDALRLDPEHVEARYYKGLGHARLSRGDMGFGNARQAVLEFRAVLRLDPSHPDAWYQLGRVQRDRYDDYSGALFSFQRQIETNPSHLSARIDLLEAYTRVGQWDEAVQTGEYLLVAAPDSARAYPHLAAAHWKQGQGKRAMEVFEGYFEQVSAAERELFFDLSLLLTPEEQAFYRSLDEEGQTHWRARYWLLRDPDPESGLNERLLEHFVRIVWSRLEFGQRIWPWDARGAFYVRYGEPDIRSRYGRLFDNAFLDGDPQFAGRRRQFELDIGMPVNLAGNPRDVERDRAWASREPERWVYTTRGIDVQFDDPVSSGRFQITRGHSRMLVQRMEHHLPMMSSLESGIPRLDPSSSVATFRGSGGRTAVEYTFALTPDHVGGFRGSAGGYTLLDVSVQLFTPEWKPVTGRMEPSRRIETVPQVRVQGVPLFVDLTRVEVEPGSYRLATLLQVPETGGRSGGEWAIEVPDYTGSDLLISDLLPAARITEVGAGRTGRFLRGDLEVIPLPGAAVAREQPIYFYYEIYNLARDAAGATDYTVRYQVSEMPHDQGLWDRLLRGVRRLLRGRTGRAVLASEFRAGGIHPDVSSWVQFDMEQIPEGTYQIAVRVTDRYTGRQVESQSLFTTVPLR